MSSEKYVPDPRPPSDKTTQASGPQPVESSITSVASIRKTHSSVVTIHDDSELEHVYGMGCRISRKHVLTCQSVVDEVTDKLWRMGKFPGGERVWVAGVGLPDGTAWPAKVINIDGGSKPGQALAILELAEGIEDGESLSEPFVTPLVYDGKEFEMLTFRGSYKSGTLIRGTFGPSETPGTVSIIISEPEWSIRGAPIWSRDVEAFVGIVGVGRDGPVCVTSAALAAFYPALPVKFRIPRADRPKIEDYEKDDPNDRLFGRKSNDGTRKLTATMEERSDGYYSVRMRYEVLPRAPRPTGRFVTFITYPDMEQYELFAELDSAGKAEVEFRPFVPDFTIAAIGDAGETRLTLNLETLRGAGSSGPAKSEETSNLGSSEAGQDKVGDREVPVNKPTPSGIGHLTALRNGPSGYSSEFMAVGRSGTVEDQLRVADYAERLAELIALRETKLPLAVGLFGYWGSGKSHFMNLLDQHLRSTADKARKNWEARFPNGGSAEIAPKGPWCHQIVAVYFNAWHYLDTNLWASLIAQIFDRLFDHLKPKQDEFKKVQELLEQASGTAARATEELAIAHQEATKAQAELDTAKATCAQQETFVRGLLDRLKELLPDVRNQEERK